MNTANKKNISEDGIMFISKNPEDTFCFGKKIARLLNAGDILALSGELGSGKTWLVKGISAGLNVPDYEYVNSPAFDLIHEYKGDFSVYHMDFYRMDYLSEEDIPWLEEYLYADGVTIIEWAEKHIDRISDSYIWIKLSYIEDDINARAIGVTIKGDRYSMFLKNIEEHNDYSRCRYDR
jgi:tRNA threonylcarbamoyladenosine biosynthesis protein TsaE